MKRAFFKYLIYSAAFCIVIIACVKKTKYPAIPEIVYKDFYPFPGDSADLQIKFTDGDGDIGVSDGDTTRTFWYTYYYKDTITQKYRAYYVAALNDTLRIGYVVKAPEDSYKGKPISGEVSVRLQQLRHSKKIKNIKYVIYLFDAAGNKSNVVTTPELYVD